MSGALRGVQQLASGQVMNVNDVSATFAYVGSADNVVVVVKNTGGSSTTIKIQIGFPYAGGAGRNTLPTDWYDYNGATSITVAAGADLAIDLSPFAPQFLQIVNTGSQTTISAWVHSNG